MLSSLCEEKMKNKHKTEAVSKIAAPGSFSGFFMPSNYDSAKEALRRVTDAANTEQKAVIMAFRGSRETQCC